MKPRVLMLTHQCAGGGGSFQRAISLARPLAQMGYAMTLLASRADIGSATRRSDWHGVRILEMPDFLPWRVRNAGLSPLDLAWRVKHIWGGDHDLLHIFDHRPAVSLPALWRRDPKVPLISDWADLWGREGLSENRTDLSNVFLKPLDSALEPYVHKRGDALTVISTDLRNRALRLGIPHELIRLVQVGSNSDIVRPTDAATARAKYGIPLDAPVVAYCGFSALDADLLADSMLELLKLVPSTLLIMTGARVASLEHKMGRYGLSGQVRHFDIVPYEQLGEVLSCGDVMLLPYRDLKVNAARFPNRFGEYLAVGRPIATNRVGDHAAIVEEERIGVATRPDPRSFAEGIASLLLAPGLLAEMGARARRLAETRFSWKAIAMPIAELYAGFLGPRPF